MSCCCRSMVMPGLTGGGTSLSSYNTVFLWHHEVCIHKSCGCYPTCGINEEFPWTISTVLVRWVSASIWKVHVYVTTWHCCQLTLRWPNTVFLLPAVLCKSRCRFSLFFRYSKNVKKESGRSLSNESRKTLYWDCLRCFANGCAAVLNILSLKSILTTPMLKINWEVHVAHLKVLVKCNWWWNFTCVCTIYISTHRWNFITGFFLRYQLLPEIVLEADFPWELEKISWVPMGICFWFFLKAMFYIF